MCAVRPEAYVAERLMADLVQMLAPAETGPKLATVDGEPVAVANDEGEATRPKSA